MRREVNKEQGAKRMRLFNIQRDAQRGINSFNFLVRECADIIGQHGFWETDQIIAINSTVLLKPFIDANFDLGWNVFIFGTNRGANYGGEFIVNKPLSGNNEVNPVFFWVVF